MIINPCPTVTTCTAQEVEISNNQDLLTEIDTLRSALAFCNQQIAIISTCQAQFQTNQQEQQR